MIFFFIRFILYLCFFNDTGICCMCFVCFLFLCISESTMLSLCCCRDASLWHTCSVTLPSTSLLPFLNLLPSLHPSILTTSLFLPPFLHTKLLSFSYFFLSLPNFLFFLSLLSFPPSFPSYLSKLFFSPSFCFLPFLVTPPHQAFFSICLSLSSFFYLPLYLIKLLSLSICPSFFPLPYF